MISLPQLYLIVVSCDSVSVSVALSFPQLHLIVVSCDSVSVSVAVASGFIVAPDGGFNRAAVVKAVKLHNRRWPHEQVR